ncbi:hypothetical protein [Kaistella sp.]|uniref:hypothetical protein n=1 Tax=Kaistella sp. TaxID=2782235 RepID=UPI003C61C1B6
MIQFTEIKSSFNISWGYKIDPIYRVVGKKEHLDDFFENGNIFISSFENFKNYDDEMQGDISEGQSLIGGFDKDGSEVFVSLRQDLLSNLYRYFRTRHYFSCPLSLK